MKIVHFSQFAPNQCGLYHTAKELVLAERLAGLDARMVAYGDKYDGKKKDGNFETEELIWAYGADFLVRHSAIPTHLQCAGIPIVIAMHGRPESSARLEAAGSNPVVTSFYNKTFDKRHKGYFCFWPEYIDYWKVIIPQDKLFLIPSAVDLNEYSPENKPFDLGEYKAKYNILISDIWRDDVTPFNCLFAAVDYARKNKDVKIHMCGIPNEYIKTIAPFIVNLRKEGVLGYVHGQTRDIKGLYTACDVLVTPHVIATRSIREAMASGLKIVAGSGCMYTPFTANPMDIKSFSEAIRACYEKPNGFLPREIAKKEFSLLNMGLAAKKAFEKLQIRPVQTQRKVMIDIGGHLGETVRRFYREVDDADQYEIYSFEPEPATFIELDRNVGHIKNVNLINAMAGLKAGMETFYVGKDNHNEGGTSLIGKTTGGIDYKQSIKVESINFADWIRDNINDGDYVILKMNIEGGEYDLMEMLMKENLTGKFNKIFIQLHSHKFDMGEQKERFQKIEADFYNVTKGKVFMKNKGFYEFNVNTK
jgi:FkbM family methyltransferase